MRWADDPKRAAIYAACAFGLAGPFSLFGAIANGPRYEQQGGSVLPIVLAGGGALVIAILIPFLPWRRWGMRATLVLPVLAVAMLVASEVGSKSSRTVDGVMSTSSIVTLIFVWIGITQPRWYCVIASPFVALSLCLAFAAERASISVATTLMTVGISVVLGELIGWVKHAETVRSQELGLVIDGTSDLRSETDRIAAAQRLVMTVRDLVRVPNVAVYLPEDDGALRLAAKAGGIPWDTIRTSGSKTGELVLSAVTAGNELAIPLIGRAGQLRGVAVATGRRRPDEFMMRLAQILGEQAGYQFDDLAQLHALADENRRDALTGVGNRRYADEVLASLQPGDVVAVVDLDDLRGINARLGHHGGDESIRAIARHLVAAVRTDDAVARLGGDEFLILLRRADTDVGLLIERIAAEWNDEHPDASFSIGAIVHGGGDPEATLRSADNALFRAKHDGRARAHVEVRDELRQPDAAGF